jgi:hypothetical protein
MYQMKTKTNDKDVLEYVNTFSDERKEDIYTLLELFTKVSGYSPKMFGDSIIGFGSYDYKYASGHSGTAPLASFSPRKNNITIYFSIYDENRLLYLDKLGKHKSSVGCIYINKLSDIDIKVLEELIRYSISNIKKV